MEMERTTLPSISARWCFTDDSSKERENYFRKGWYSTLEGIEGLMGERNTRASLSPLHSEI